MRKAMKWFFGGCSLILLAFLLFFGCAKVIPLDLTSKKEKITLYDINQNVFYESNFNEQMSWHKLDEFPNEVIDYIIQIEDKRFYQHLGFDPIRITKAMINNLKAQKIVEGGSSLSQQMAKNLFLTNKQTYSRKIKELFYAAQMEMQYSKQEILEGYLNTLYFGHGIYGFHQASEFFFNQPLTDCSTAQLVMLIGIINGPSIYSPFIDYEASLNRTHILLSYLKDEEALNKENYDKAIQEKIILAEEKYEEDDASYYIQAVLDEINTLKLDTSAGAAVYTSYDPKAQHALSESIRQNASKDECESSGIILDPSTGGVKALSGGKSFTESEYIRPLYSERQIGSTVKALLYYNALKAGFTPSTLFMSSPTTFQIDENTTYAPINYDKRYPNREISLINAIAVSDNIYAMKTHLFLGMDILSDSLKAFHIDAQPLPSLALGTCEMSLMELASIYNTFASMGYYTKPSFIKAVYQNQNVLYENAYTRSAYLDSDITLILNQLLTSTFDIKNKTVTMPTLVNIAPVVKVAAKSGTSDFDSLIVGFNPDYTIAVWSGFDDARILKEAYFQISKKIFKQTFDKIYEDETVSGWYQRSRNIEERTVNPITGEESLLGSEYWYLK